MTAGTRVMVRSIARINKRCITVAVRTACCTYRDARMAGITRMGRLPGACMTGGTVGRARVAHGRSDQGTTTGIMTARAGIMCFRYCTYQRIIMTARTISRTYRDTGMAGIIHMESTPVGTMTGRTVTAGCKGLANRCAD